MAVAIRVGYALAIGIFVLMTVASGLVSFYQQPDAPDFPRVTGVARPFAQPGVELTEAEKKQVAEFDAAQEAAQVEYDAAYELYKDELATYSRNALAVVTLIGLAFIVGGLTVAGALDTLRIGRWPRQPALGAGVRGLGRWQHNDVHRGATGAARTRRIQPPGIACAPTARVTAGRDGRIAGRLVAQAAVRSGLPTPSGSMPSSISSSAIVCAQVALWMKKSHEQRQCPSSRATRCELFSPLTETVSPST
ncbi:MAG TPA: hypothetical protein QGI71_00745 [Dehalococcoidia bacterium]|nr:hypothetical protein [Dehalococcoidia bacterium]